MLSRCAAVRGSRQGRENVLRSVDGGGEVDLDKRAITGEDDIVELDQLHSQHTEPPAAPHDCDHTLAEQAKPPRATTGATPTTSTGEAKPPRRIVVLSDETGNEDARLGSPDHGRARPPHAAPSRATTRHAPRAPATSERSNLGLPSSCVTIAPRPLQTAPVTADDAPQAAATGHRRGHPHARAHRRDRHRAGRRRPRPSRAQIPERRHRPAPRTQCQSQRPSRTSLSTPPANPPGPGARPTGGSLTSGDITVRSPPPRRRPSPRRKSPAGHRTRRPRATRRPAPSIRNPRPASARQQAAAPRHPPTNSRRARAAARPSRQKPR